ncbi:MAG: efflux RND transporter permease subunit, partial [Spirochaetaceae bacterium]|nr:efflux RND transporter permease subunit [Spirochaetaceae bacterium]
MKIADYAIKHPKVILMLLIVLLVFGVLSALTLRRNLIAKIAMPTVAVVTTWPGVGPEDIEEEITKPLEDVLGTLEGLKRMTSVSRNSVSVIELELDYGEETDRRVPEIREKINSAMRDLPEELSSPPTISQYSTALLPIMTIIVEGEGSRSDLSDYCRDEIIPALSHIPGVAQVTMKGDSRDVAEITADLDLLKAVGLSLLDVAGTVPASNLTIPGGDGIYHGYNLNIRTEGRYASLEDIEEQALAYKDGKYIRIKDIAKTGIKEDRRNNYVITNSKDSLALSIMKQDDGDSLAISKEVRRILGDLEKDYTGGLSFSYIKDDADNISLSLNSVINSAILGAVLAVIILFVFLHNRNTTLIVGFSIPLSILFALVGLKVKGSSLDLITLGGLTAAIGMVVDASIVILEMIQRHFDSGLGAAEAASKGTGEVGAAVVASTATTLVAFFPILFLSGLAGIILRDVAWTIIFALFSSLLVAVVVVPFLCGIFLNKERKRNLGVRIAQPVEKVLGRLTSLYEKFLKGALARRKSFLIGTLVLLAISLLSLRLLGFEFLAQTDMAEIEVSVETPGGYTLEMTRDKVLRLEQAIKELLPREFADSYFVVGESGPFTSGKEKNRAYGTLKLTRVRDRKRHVTAIINELQSNVPRMIPDLKADFSNGGLSNLLSLATGGEGLMVNVYGNTIDTVISGAEQVRRYMLLDPNVASADLDIRFDQQEMSARLIHQNLGLLGLSSREAATINRIIFNGVNLGTFYSPEGKNYPIELRTPFSGGKIPQDILYSLGLNTPQGVQVSFANFAELETELSLSQINHRNKLRAVSVRATLKDPNVRESARLIAANIEKEGLVPGASWELGGSTAEMFSSFSSLFLVLGMAVFLVYAVMVIQFERFLQPLLVMSSIPFTMIGITAGLLLFGSSLNIVSLLGIIALAGVVVNNAIVLIDYINLLRTKYNMPLEEAVVTGALSRLKPILMTTLTTLLGIIPLAVGRAEGSEIYSPLGQSIFGGLFSSTFITLFFIPVIYLIVERHQERKQQHKLN